MTESKNYDLCSRPLDRGLDKVSLSDSLTLGVENASGGTPPLVDKTFYTEIYKGAEVYDDLDILLGRASDIVRQHSLYCLDKIENLPEFMQENIKKAVCAQVEYINSCGGLESLNSDSVPSFSIGKFSMTCSGKNSSGGSSSPASAAPLMLSYLESAGLLYRGSGLNSY